LTNYISRAEADELCDGLIMEFAGKNKKLPDSIDIDRFVRDYLKCTVVYETIAEADKDCIAFASDGKRAIKIRINGIVSDVIYPKNTIVLDKYLLNKNENNRRRFALAHEAGHILANRINPDSPAYFHRFNDKERDYTIEDFRERYNLNEWQANVFAAALLMPRCVIKEVLNKFNDGKTIPVYGENVFRPREKTILNKIADSLQVSYTALVIRLKTLNLLNRRDISEYIQKELRLGGE